MSKTTMPCTDKQIECIQEILERVASDLSMITDSELKIDQVESSLEVSRPAGPEKPYISFRLGFRVAGRVEHGCMLVPLPDAISLASCLMMVPSEVVQVNRGMRALDATTKDAMLEVGSFVSGAADSALRGLGLLDAEVSFEGCQGVKPNVRPSLIYQEGTELLVGRALVSLAEFPQDLVLFVVPAAVLGG